MTRQTYRTRAEAMAEINRMRGWNARPAHIYWPGHENANRRGYVWVIECREIGSRSADPRYLRTDGYVR